MQNYDVHFAYSTLYKHVYLKSLEEQVEKRRVQLEQLKKLWNSQEKDSYIKLLPNVQLQVLEMYVDVTHDTQWYLCNVGKVYLLGSPSDDY